MVSLLPSETMEQLKQLFGSKFTELTEDERAALAITSLEGSVTHSRLQSLTTDHPIEISRNLQRLVKTGFLNTSGGRGAVYTLIGSDILTPRDIFEDSASNALDSVNNNNNTSLVINESHSTKKTTQRDHFGRLCSKKLPLPIVDNLDELSDKYKEYLFKIAKDARNKQRIAPKLMESIILTLCQEQYFTLSALASVLNRKPESLRRSHLTKLIKNKHLNLAFPTTPTHEKQAYLTNPELNKNILDNKSS